MYILTKQITKDMFDPDGPVLIMGYTENDELARAWRASSCLGERYDTTVAKEITEEIMKKFIHNGRSGA